MTTIGDCIFCRVISGEFGGEFVAESEHAVAFRDLHPAAPVHVLVVSKTHVRSLSELAESDASLAGELLLLASRVAAQEGLNAGGYRVVTNVGPDGGQTVFHLHLHVLGGRPLGTLVG